MTRTIAAVLAAGLLGPGAALAQDAIDGTWKLDLTSVHPSSKPEVMVLQDGMFQCATCTPPYKVKADGTRQPIPGSPYRDQVAVKILGPNSLEQTFYKAGRQVGDGTGVVSPDGKTLTVKFIDSSSSTTPVTGTVTEVRVAAGPPSSAPISGSWRVGKEAMSDNQLLVTYKTKGGMLSMTTATGQSYMVKLDGTEGLYKGDPGTTSVSVTKAGPRTYVETDKRDGKVIAVETMTLAPDGRSATFVNEDRLAGTTSSIGAHKQ